MPESQLVDCKVIIKHQPTYLKGRKYGLTVTQSSPAHIPGSERMLEVQNDEALFAVLFDLGYSAPEIATVTRELEQVGADYTDEHRMIPESALAKHGW